MGAGQHMARILKQAAKGRMAGGRERNGENSYTYKALRNTVTQRTRSRWSGEKAELRRDSFSTLTS